MNLIYLFFGLYLPVSIFATESKLPYDIFLEKTKESKNKVLAKEDILCEAKVEDKEEGKKQDLNFFIAGIHQKTCVQVMRKLSLFEQYEDFLDLVTKSTYDDTKSRWILDISSILMPFDMTIDFILPKFYGPGVTRFQFNKGILRGLTGIIQLTEVTVENQQLKKSCLFTSSASWHGPHSKIPSSVFSFFSQALGKKTMEALFRISK